MATSLNPSALVTVRTLTPYGRVDQERFEVPHELRPVWLNPELVYSIERFYDDADIRLLTRSAPVDIATWLHRAGMWDRATGDAQGR